MITVLFALLVQFPPIPEPPKKPELPGLPGLPGSEKKGGAGIVEEPRFIYKLADHPELPVQFDKLKEEQLVRIIKRGKQIIKSKEIYDARRNKPKSWKGSVDALKGYILEEIFIATPAFDELMTWAKERAAEEGIPAGDVQLIQDLVDARLVGSAENPRQLWAPFTDGVIAAIVPDLSEEQAAKYKGWREGLVDAEGKPVPGKALRIFAVIESKAPTQVGKLVQGEDGDSGQVEMDFERFFELPLRFGEETLPAERVLIHRKQTRWITALPYQWQQAFSPNERAELDKLFEERLKHFNWTREETQVLTSKAEVVAENVFYCLHVRGFFKDY